MTTAWRMWSKRSRKFFLDYMFVMSDARLYIGDASILGTDANLTGFTEVV